MLNLHPLRFGATQTAFSGKINPASLPFADNADHVQFGETPKKKFDFSQYDTIAKIDTLLKDASPEEFAAFMDQKDENGKLDPYQHLSEDEILERLEQPDDMAQIGFLSFLRSSNFKA